MKHYVAVIQGLDDKGTIQLGNAWFSTESLTRITLEQLKQKHCEALDKEGIRIKPNHTVILSVIRLD